MAKIAQRIYLLFNKLTKMCSVCLHNEIIPYFWKMKHNLFRNSRQGDTATERGMEDQRKIIWSRKNRLQNTGNTQHHTLCQLHQRHNKNLFLLLVPYFIYLLTFLKQKRPATVIIACAGLNILFYPPFTIIVNHREQNLFLSTIRISDI